MIGNLKAGWQYEVVVCKSGDMFDVSFIAIVWGVSVVRSGRDDQVEDEESVFVEDGQEEDARMFS